MSTTLGPRPATRGGRQLSSAEVRETVERYAHDVRAGRYVAEFDSDRRWHVRIHQDADVDVWLISWTTEQGTQLHDHGGSSGAFSVVDGVLDEYVWSGSTHDAPGMLVRRVRHEQETVVFDAHYVHDVCNRREQPAVSVHAYSPPIRLMRYYDSSDGSLLRWAASWTDDPEQPAPAREAAFASIEEMLAAARGTLDRLTPEQAERAARDGAQLVDIRPEWQRRADGEIPGAIVIERNHLEWRVHHDSDARLSLATQGRRWVIYCTEGYTSSLAAATLVSLGLDATDIIGGIHGWRQAGLPTVPGSTQVEHIVGG
ncbi:MULTISPECIES: rhodanese-like domain-containing protein [unclassified Nocardioides]|uniref:rhodanese-like domain-containing protein n=1 Tax=unclassified Nocardioides TaxID=2615069 RepID=UPI00360C413F